MKNSNSSSLKFNFDKSTLRILYYKNKDYVVPVMVIFASILLFLFVVVTQIQNFFSLQSEVSATKERIAVLRSNLAILAKLDDNSLSTQLELVSNALPTEKNFPGVLNAVTTASRNANVSLNDFSFEVGELSSSSARLSSSAPLALNLSLNIAGGVSGTQRLMHELAKTMPVSQVLDVNIQSNLATLVTNFYYKPFTPIRVDYATPVVSFSEKEKEALEMLSSF